MIGNESYQQIKNARKHTEKRTVRVLMERKTHASASYQQVRKEVKKMGRLIDSDALLKKFCVNSEGRRIPEVDCDNHEITVSIKDIKKIIREQPTAYDVDKVIEDLSSNSRFIDDINVHNIKCISCIIGQKTAIDIVKRGGVE